MSGIIRAPRPARGWTEIQNETLRDGRLSYRARGILARLLSNADGYRMTALELAHESPAEGRQAILTGLRELREAGYILQNRLQDDRGQWRTETFVHDTPQTPQKSTEVRLPDSGSTEVRSPDVGQPDVGGPDVGGPDRISKNSEKKQKNEHKKTNHQNQRERGEAPPEGGKPPLSPAGGGHAVKFFERQHGICLQAGNERDARAMREIERHSETEIACAVSDARSRDPQGRAWPTAVLRLLLQAQHRTTAAASAASQAPAWARLFPAPPRASAEPERGHVIDITDIEME